jgi:fused signal recognition particle receptor
MVLNFIKSSYQKLKNTLAKTGSLLGSKIRSLFQGGISEESLEKLEKLFYEADLGVQTSLELTNKIKEIHKKNPSITTEDLISEIRIEILKMVPQTSDPMKKIANLSTPHVILIVGVNGNGKTTSVAKLAKKYQDAQKQVLIAAADTFRAAATEQLDIWASRLQVALVKGNPKSDPAAVVFDALTSAKARNIDIVLIDTAGRLHTKTHLMQELEKIKRTCHKVIPSSPHETLLVLDATTGQNAIDQAKTFHQFTPITGLILTKLDGTAKGGIVISIQKQLGIPVKFIGIGEELNDLEPFDNQAFVQSLFE